MKNMFRLTGIAAAVLMVALMPARAQDNAKASAPVSTAPAAAAPMSREAIERIVHDYLVSHPEVLQEAYAELEKRQAAADSEKQKVAVTQYKSMLFESPRQVVLGNPNGNVTMVEFFDYNCGYCKRAMSDMLSLLKNDPNLRVVLKEFPVLGPGSVEAAKVASAALIQDKGSKKYLDFHTRLLGGRGEANKARALQAAREAGYDIARIERDMESAEVQEELKESAVLSQALGINGTPSYVVGHEVVIGAVGLDALKGKINSARCGQASC